MSTYICVALLANAQTVSYDLSSIPDSVKKDASVVTQYDLQRVIVEEQEKATYTRKRIFSVLSEQGKEALMVYVYSTKYVNLDDLELKVYDKTGKQISKYKKKDLMMEATGEGLVEDGAYYYVSVPAPSYPVTLELDYVIKFKGTLNLPSFQILRPGESIVSSLFEAIVPMELGLRYRSKNI
ncbi:MAG: DUF3857 domain-containing protein, partial [Chitinophagaceae bacterium]|nr:DUF3857 domain-containing protein [Chitinophagaceae bacterium]